MTTVSDIPLQSTDRRAVLSWALFDWAAQPFFTLITTFVFAPYFASTLGRDPSRRPIALGIRNCGRRTLHCLCSTGTGLDRGRNRPAKTLDPSLLVAVCHLLLGILVRRSGKPERHRHRACRLCHRHAVHRNRDRLQQRHDAFAGAAGTHRTPVQFRLGTRLRQWTGHAGDRPRIFSPPAPSQGKTLLGFKPVLGLDAATQEGDRAVGPFSALWVSRFRVADVPLRAGRAAPGKDRSCHPAPALQTCA